MAKGEVKIEINLDSNKAEKNIEELDDNLNDLGDSVKNISKGDDFKGISDSAKDTAKQVKSLGDRVKDTTNKLFKMKDPLNALPDGVDGANGGFTVFKGIMAELGAGVIQGVIQELGNLVGALFDTIEATSEYRNMMATLKGSSKNFGYEVGYAKDKFAELYEYLGDNQMAANAITNLMGLQVETGTLDQLVNGSIATWTAYGDSIPIESLTESVTESIKVGKVVGTLADTLNWASLNSEQWNSVLGQGTSAQYAFNDALSKGLPVEDAFSAALASTSNEQERARIVAGMLNATYGESKKTYDKATQAQRDLNAEQLRSSDLQSKVAESMIPVKNSIDSLKNDALEAMLPVIEDVSESIQNFFNFLNSGTPEAEALKTVLIALAAALGALMIIGVIAGLVSLATAAFSALGTVIAIITSPITLIIAAIAALVAGILYLWNTNEGFRNAVTEIWNAIVSFISTAINNIVNFFTVTVPNGIQNMLTWFQNLPSNIWNYLTNVISKVGSFASNFAQKAIQAGQDFFNNIVNKVKEIPGQMLSIGGDIVNGIWNGIKGAWDGLVSGLSGLVSDFTSGLAGFLGIGSPSKLMRDAIGRWLPPGIAIGFEKSMPKAELTMEKSLMKAVDSMNHDMNSRAQRYSLRNNHQGSINNYKTNSNVFNQTINSPKPTSPSENARAAKNMMKRMAFA